MDRGSMGVLEERERIREEILRKAKEWADDLPFKATVIIVGSYARGDFNLWSDVDVLLISEFAGNPIERLRSLDYPPGFDVIPLTPDELVRLTDRRDPLVSEALNVGVFLRDDLGIREKLKEIDGSLTSLGSE
ncbi:MAG: nucleotidyltransferase domain-containing protein [Candidatus Korarchaeum sp.]